MATSIIVKTKWENGVLFYFEEDGSMTEFGRVELVEVVDQPDAEAEGKTVREAYVATLSGVLVDAGVHAFDREEDARNMLYHRLMETMAIARN